MNNATQYRTEAPIELYEVVITNPSFFTIRITAGRGEVIKGHSESARTAYKLAQTKYRYQLRIGAIVPAIIDEHGNAA